MMEQLMQKKKVLIILVFHNVLMESLEHIRDFCGNL
jgi:hypothetical protein